MDENNTTNPIYIELNQFIGHNGLPYNVENLLTWISYVQELSKQIQQTNS